MVGAKAGAFLGGIIGATISGEAAHSLLDKITKDDVEEMLDIINERLIIQVQESLLNEEELELVIDELGLILVDRGELLNMFASHDREVFVDALNEQAIKRVICFRAKIILPSTECYLDGINHVLELSEKEGGLNEYFSKEKISTKNAGRLW